MLKTGRPVAGSVADNGSMRRSQEAELQDAEGISEETMRRAYRELWWVNRFLGNVSTVLRLLRDGSCGGKTRRVLDIGCGRGALLVEIQKKLGMEVVGLDVRPAPVDAPVLIVKGNAVIDALPAADTAVCVLMAHHLLDAEFAGMIRNVAKSCRRLVVLDLVRHPVPIWLFRIFIAPWLCRINASDGVTSIQRAYTATEMDELVSAALKEIPRRAISVRHTVAPFWIRQVVDICWE